MRRFGQARRRDANEPEIVQALMDLGLCVYKIAGPGMPDLLVYDPWAVRNCAWIAIEVKSHLGQLTKAQKATAADAKFPIVRNAAEAVALFVNGRSWAFDMDKNWFTRQARRTEEDFEKLPSWLRTDSGESPRAGKTGERSD